MNNDYVDFKFGDHWASEFNLLAVSNGDRHNPPVYGNVNPNTATIMGKKGVYKWKTQINEKIFNINIAFDSVTIAQLNQIKQWLEPHKIQKLIFADEPYKYYWAALNSEIDFNFLPFIEGEKKVGERTIIEGVYKGEMTIPFICIDNDGYSEEGTFEGLENEPELAIVKGSNFVITDADSDYIEDLKIEGKSEQEVKYNNDLSDTDFTNVNSRSVEKEWKTNNLAQIQAENGEVTINAPYEYSGIAQEQRESIIDHKYYASAEVKTDNINTALEIAGKNITNSVQGKDINITDGLVGTVDDLVVGGDASQDKKYNNEINSSFLEDLDNWESVQNATVSRNKQTATVTANSKFDGIAQETEESNIGDKYYLSAKVKSNSSDTVLEVETEKGIAEGEQITINDAADRKLNDFKLYGNSQQEKYEEQLLGTGESIAINNNTYKRYTKVNVSGNTIQEAKEKIEGNTVNGENIDLNDIDDSKEHEIKIIGNCKQETRSGKNKIDLAKCRVTTLNGVTSTYNKENNSITFNGTCTVDNTTFHIYENGENADDNNVLIKNNSTSLAQYVSGNVTGYSVFRLSDENWQNKIGLDLTILNSTNKKIFATYNGANAIIKYLSFRFEKGTVLNNFTVQLMLTDTVDTEYEMYGAMPSPNYPSEVESCGDNGSINEVIDNGLETTDTNYKSQTYTIPTQKPMLKEDYFDFKNNKEVHVWQKVEFTGDERWALNATYTNTIRFSLGASYLGISNIGYCNRNFVRTTEAHGDYEYVFFANNLIYFNILKENLPTDKQNLEGFIELLRQWNSEGKPLKLYYRASQIEELDLTDEQIEVGKQISNSTLYSGTTHIYSTDEIAPVLEVKYNSQKESPSPESPSPIKNCENSINVKLTNGSQSKVISFPLVSRQKLHEGDYLAKDGIHQVRKTIVLTGNEDWLKHVNTTNNVNTYQLLISDMTATQEEKAKVTHYRFVAQCWNIPNKDAGQFALNNGNIYFNSDIGTVEEFKAYLAEQYSNGTPVIIEYRISGETIIPYTSEQQTAYNQLMYLTMYQEYNLLTSDDEIKPQLEWIIPESPSPDYPLEIEYCGNNVNLFNKDNITVNKLVNGNGVLEINNSWNSSNYIKVDSNEYYTFSKDKISKNQSLVIAEYDENKNFIKRNIQGQSDIYIPYTVQLQSNTRYVILCYNNTFKNIDFKFEKGKIATPYSPYGQDYINEVICNKNLAKINETDWTLTDNNTIKNKAKNGGSVLTEFYLKKGQTIKISLKLMSKPTRDSTFTIYANSHNNVINSFERFHNYELNKTYTVTYTATENSIIYLILWGNGNSDIFEFQFWAELDNVTEYLPHKSQTYTIPTQQPMRSVGNTRDTFIKKNNKWYERHYCSRYIFTGTETVSLQNGDKRIYVRQSSNTNITKPFNPYNQSDKYKLLFCNYLEATSAVNTWGGVQGISYDINANSGYEGFDIAINAFTTAQEYLDWFKEKYDEGNPFYADYILETPLDIECTEEQNAILDSIKAYRETTYIYSTDNIIPSMQLEYVKKPQQQAKLFTTNTQETLSMIYQTNIDNTRVLVSNIGSSASSIELTNPVLVNLTKQFGSGNEPTKEWCDQNLTFFNCAEGGAPSVETSSRVKTVGSNINLFDPNNHIELVGQHRSFINGVIGDNANFLGLKIPVLGDTVYSASSNMARNMFSNLCYFDENFNFMWGEAFNGGTNTFRTPNKCRYITLALNRNYSWFKLEYGNTITQPSEYNLANIDTKIIGYDNQFKSFPLLAGQELLQLSNGTQDTLEANGIYKRVGKYIVTGQEQFTDNGTYAVIAPTNCKENSKVYSNYFEDKQNILWGVNSGIAFGYNNDIKNLAELRTFLQEKYNSTNPVIIYYELKTQQIIPYSNAQKEWYDDFAIYRKNTQITTVAEIQPYYSFTYDINDTYAVNSTKVNEYEKLGLIFNNLEDRPRFIVNSTADVNSTIKMRKPIVVDLTNEFGVGNEPDLEWCQNNINFDNSCEYGTPSPKVPSELISIGTNPIKIENKSRNLIMEQNLLNWRKRNCSITKLDEKFNDRSVFRINYENHFIGDISTKIQISNKDLVFSAWVRVINADNPTQNRLSVSKATSSSSSSVTITSTTFQNKIGEWQKVFVPIPQNIIADAAELTLRVNHSRPTDDSTVIDVCMPQLEEGFTPHDYLPYAPSITNNLIFTEPLRQLPNGVRDEFSKNGIIRRVGKHIIKSTDDVWEATFSINKQYIIINGELGIYIRGDNFNKAPSFLCNRFKDCVSLFDISKGATSTREKEGIGVMDDEYRLCIRADLIGATQTDTEDDIIRKYKVWLADNPIEIYYEKEVASLEPLTELQLNTLNNLITRKFYNNWVISGSENPEIELTYKLSSSINDIHPWVTGSNLLDKTWLYNDNNIHTKSYIEVETGDATKSGVSADRPVYLLNSGTTESNLNLKFDYISIVSPLTIKITKGKITDNGFSEIAPVSEITIKPFLNYQPFIDLYDNNPSNWYIEIDSTLGEVYLRHKTDESKVLNLNRFNDNHTFLTLASCNFVDYNKVFPTIISEIKDTAIENTIFNKLSVASAPEAYRLKNASIEWKHTYL